MNSLRSRGWTHRVRSRAWAVIAMAAVLAFSFSDTLVAQQKVELKGITLEAVGQPVFTHNNGLPVRVTAMFSDGSKKDVTKDPNCKFITAGHGLHENDGKVHVSPKGNERSFTLQASYSFAGKTEHARLAFRIHDDYVYLPDVWGGPPDNLEKVRPILEARGLKVKTVPASTHTCPFDVGKVWGSKPDRYSIVKKGSTVRLSYNPEGIPSVVGKSEREARDILQGKGLKAKVLPAIFYMTNHPPGVVVSQTPAAPASDKSVRESPALVKGATVRLVVNGQPIVVPDVIGKTEAEAQKILRGVRLRWDVGPSALHDPNHDVGKVVDQTPEKGAGVANGTKIRLGLNPAPLPRMGITVKPPRGPYKMQEWLTFLENLDRKGKNIKYIYTWYIDGKKVGDDIWFVRHQFTEPGPHYVQLVTESPAQGWKDAIIKNIGIEYPPDPELGIWVNPSGPYIPGQRITLEQNCKNLPSRPMYNWYFGFFDDKFGTGLSVEYNLPDEKGTYAFTLGLRFGSDNFDSLKKTITITVGDPPIKPLGRWRNKFRAEGPMTNLKIQSSEWQPGFAWSQGLLSVKKIPAKWKDWVMVRNLGSVEGYDLYTGQQSGGHNSGFLVYLPSGSEKLQYKVFGHNFVKHKGVLNHEGYLNMHGKVPDPQSIRWVDKKSRAGVVQWQTTDGNLCKARIWKTRGSSTMWSITQSVFIKGGVEDLGCSKGAPSIAGYDPASDPGTGGSSSGTVTAIQIGQQFQNSNASTGTSTGGGQGGSGNLTNVTVSQQDITVTFWDHGQEDGDIINIYLNGQLFKGNVILTNKKEEFQVKLNSGNNTFEVEAVNEGSVSPNTASVRISHVTLGKASQIYEKKSGKRTSMNLSAP